MTIVLIKVSTLVIFKYTRIKGDKDLKRYRIDQFLYLEQTANRKMYVGPTFDGVI